MDGRDGATNHAGVMGDHLIVLHSAVRACPGYSRHEAPSILLDGSSIARDTEHGRAMTAQLTRRHGTLEEAIESAGFALGAAGLFRASAARRGRPARTTSTSGSAWRPATSWVDRRRSRKAGALLVVIYLGRLIILDPANPLVLGPAAISGLVVGPAWYAWLGWLLFTGRALSE